MVYGIVYKHTNKITGKVYIGQTIQLDNLERRFRHSDKTHHSYKSCPAFFNALNKYGWENFITERLYSAFDRETLNRAEEKFIIQYNSVAPNGYNSSMMVDGSIVFTPEIKKKISDARKANSKKKKELGIITIAATRKHHIFVEGLECKNCARCKVTKPLNQYNKYKKRWDGLHNYCNVCQNGLRMDHYNKKKG